MKKILFIVGLILVAGQSWGSWLYFQIDPQGFVKTNKGNVDFDYAAIYAVQNPGDEGILLVDASGTEVFTPGHGYDEDTYIDLIQLGDDDAESTYSYYIEVYDNDFNVVAISETQSYSDLKGGNYIVDIGMDPSAYWHGEGYTVPEPTSGMMLLLGMGLLGLRRRRMKEVA